MSPLTRPQTMSAYDPTRCDAKTAKGAQCKHVKGYRSRWCTRHLNDSGFRPSPDNTMPESWADTPTQGGGMTTPTTRKGLDFEGAHLAAAKAQGVEEFKAVYRADLNAQYEAIWSERNRLALSVNGWEEKLSAMRAEHAEAIALLREADTECPVWCEQVSAFLLKVTA